MRAPAALIAVALALLVAFWAAHAMAQSPYGGGPGRAFTGPAPGTQAAAPPASPGFWDGIYRKIEEVQLVLRRQLSAAMRRLKNDDFSAAWLLAGLGFLYGVVHAVGPGHGKAVISSYVLAEERTVRRGVVLSFLAAGVQAVSAVAIVGILAILFGAAGSRINATAAWLETASYAFIALLGAWMTFGQVRALVASRAAPGAGRAHHEHGHAHTHAHGDHGAGACHGHAHMPDPRALAGDLSWRKAAAVVLAVGVRPCTGAIIVLVFALANGLFLAGVGATFAMALGTAITVSVLAALAVGSKQLAVRLAGGDSVWGERIYRGIALTGALLLLAMGSVLFMASLGPARPF